MLSPSCGGGESEQLHGAQLLAGVEPQHKHYLIHQQCMFKVYDLPDIAVLSGGSYLFVCTFSSSRIVPLSPNSYVCTA